MANEFGTGFQVVGRREWGARPALSRTRRAGTDVNTVYIHWPGTTGSLREEDVHETQADDCVLPPQLAARASRIDTSAEEKAYIRSIQRFHMDVRGWSDIGYNYMIFQSGRVYRGRGFYNVPAAQAPFNTTGVAICCVVGSADLVSDAMKRQLREFVRRCERPARHELGCKGHRDVNQTTCPGDRLYALVPSLDRL